MFKHRLPSAMLLAGVMILAMTLDGAPGKMAILAIGLLTGYLAVVELLHLLGMAPSAMLHCCTAGYVTIAFAAQMLLPSRMLPATLGSLVVVGLALALGSVVVAGDRTMGVRTMSGGIVAATLIFIPLSCLAMIYLEDGVAVKGRQMLLALLLVTKSGDIGGYVCGTLTAKFLPAGNHKMAPRLSPKKSWEGLVGGLALSLLTALALRQFIPLAEAWQTVAAMIVGTMLYFGGLLGDLGISALKRAAGVKDSGNLIPGMGGMLDVVDSLLLNIPLGWLLLLLVRTG